MKIIFLALVLALSGLELSAQTQPTLPVPSQRKLRPQGTNSALPPRFPTANAPGAAAATVPNAAAADPLAAAASASASASAAALLNAKPEEVIPAGTINFQGVDVNQVLEVYAQLVNRTLLRSALPDAKIILKTQTPLTKTEAIQALQAVLALNNVSLVNIGEKFVKVLPVDQANGAGGELDRSGSTNLPSLGSYVTHIKQLNYVKPSEIIPAIQPFAKLANSILAIDANGILVLRDNAENVKRMLEMIEQIDVNVPAEYVSKVIPIRYVKVEDISSALNSLGGGGGVSASIGTSTSTRQISGVAGSRGSVLGGGGMGGGMGGMGGVGGMGGGMGGMGSRTGTTATPNGTASTGTSFQQRLNNLLTKASGTGGAAGGQGNQEIQLFGQTKIIPNESSSSLLIYATRKDLEVIKSIIAKLDVPLPQVLIEAIIMDVTLGHTFNFGVSAAQKPQEYNSSVPILGAASVNNGALLGLVKNLTNSTITGGVTNLAGGSTWLGSIGNNWDVVVRAAQTDDNASIIQRPRIQTSQAKPATFFVGETVPYVTGSTYGSAYGNSSSYSQLSVGVELDVTPFINPEGLVVMEIMQSIDDLNGYTDIEGVGQVPNTIKRTLNAEIAVRDRESVMLGGFIKSGKSHTQSGVPFLSDIPILGNLFKRREDKKGRQELIVLIRPTVLKTPELAAKHTIKEEKRMPGISGAAVEESVEERRLIDAQRKKEQKLFKKNQKLDGFLLLPEDDGTNAPAPLNPGVAPAAAPEVAPEASPLPPANPAPPMELETMPGEAPASPSESELELPAPQP